MHGSIELNLEQKISFFSLLFFAKIRFLYFEMIIETYVQSAHEYTRDD